MEKKFIKTLIVLLFLIMIDGALLLFSILGNPDLLDPTLVFGTPKIIFLVVAGLVLLFGLVFLVFHLLHEKRRLARSRLSGRPSESAKGTGEKEKSGGEENGDKPRFFLLNQIDEKAGRENGESYENDITLAQLCEEFRRFSANASPTKLYFDPADIRRFIGGLSVSHIMILQGMSGTGKTSLAYAFGEYLKNSALIVPIQPMWKERTDLIGYYNEFTKKFNETTLLKKLYEASRNEKMYITVLDEMNIARVEYYFAEFLSLLELPDQKKRNLDVVSDVWKTDPELLEEGKLVLPDNMWFVGTANNDDSTFSISDKVYDRAMVINLDRKAQPFQIKTVAGRNLSATRFRELIVEARKEYEISRRNLRRIAQLDAYLTAHFQITFGNRIMTQIRNYVPVIVACGGSELSALDDIMSKKVLRKLETKNMVYVKSAAPGLISYLDELFGEGQMTLCREYIQNIEINA